jgi:two-component system sensor histidine kinase RegB
VDEYLDDLLDEWQDARVDVEVRIDLQGPVPGAHIIADRTLSQAILNVLNNAADASSETIEVIANWDETVLTLEVIDQGGGLSPAVEARLGEPFVTTKAPGKGLGLGLYLARSTLDRLGGSIQLNNRENEGLSARITVPLAQLTTN